jgi:hypothetical protein
VDFASKCDLIEKSVFGFFAAVGPPLIVIPLCLFVGESFDGGGVIDGSEADEEVVVVEGDVEDVARTDSSRPTRIGFACFRRPIFEKMKGTAKSE